MRIVKLFNAVVVVLLATACSASRNTPASSTERESNTNGITKLNVKESDGKSYNSIFDYLRSRVPGLLIRGNEVYIRGFSSVNSQGSPLILLDGIEVTDISTVNPNEVENVEVIKDASTADYGFRGAFGVIKITTKGSPKK